MTPLRSDAAPPPLRTPWPSGQVWLANGPHGDTSGGTRYSVDLGPQKGNGTVVAAAAGRARISNKCSIDIAHSGGWTTRYQHVTFTGSFPRDVKAGEAIGVTKANDNRGTTCNSNSYSHLHFGVLQNGQPKPINGVRIGGYTVWNGSAPYLGKWTQNSNGATVITVKSNGFTVCCLQGSGGTTPPPSNKCFPIAGRFQSWTNDHVGRACYNSNAGWIWRQNTGDTGGGEIVFGWGGPSNTPDRCFPIAGRFQNWTNDHVGLACWNASGGWTWRQNTGNTNGGEIKFGWGSSANTPDRCRPITGRFQDWTNDHVGLACWNASGGWTWRQNTGNTNGGEIKFGWGSSANTPDRCYPIRGKFQSWPNDHIGTACYSTSGWTWRQNTGDTNGGEVKFGWGGP